MTFQPQKKWREVTIQRKICIHSNRVLSSIECPQINSVCVPLNSPSITVLQFAMLGCAFIFWEHKHVCQGFKKKIDIDSNLRSITDWPMFSTLHIIRSSHFKSSRSDFFIRMMSFVTGFFATPSADLTSTILTSLVFPRVCFRDFRHLPRIASLIGTNDEYHVALF